MPTLQQALASFSKTLEECRPLNGEITPAKNMDGIASASTSFGAPSPDTGQALIARSPSNETGLALGRIGVIEKPKTAEEASKLAEELVGTLLPPSMASWLGAQEYHSKTGMEVFPRVPKPERTEDMLACISQTVRLLSDITAPAKNRPDELAEILGKMMAAFNLFTGDAAKVNAQLEVWGEELQGYPMYAIRKAYKWAVRGQSKIPSLASFIMDVKLATGSGVLARKKILEQWMKS